MITTTHKEDKHLRAKRCLRCAASFEYTRCTKKYCSDSCKQIAYLERKSVDTTELGIVQLVPKQKTNLFKRIINWLWK
jgi:hypothetical protein